MSFLVQMSVLSPKAKSKHHPQFNESGFVFECKNCSLSEAVKLIREHQDYKLFCERNKFFGEPYVYYTDSNGVWHYYEGDD